MSCKARQWWAVFTVLILLGCARIGAAGASSDVAGVVRALDDAHAHRDAAGTLDRARQVVDAAVAAHPTSYELLWRAARLYFSLSDQSERSKAERSSLGTTGWELGQRATAANPKDAAGYYWSALAIGSSAVGIGVLRALTTGIEGKFTAALARAAELNPRYDHGNVYVAWGAYYKELPWPKRDRPQARARLMRALEINPDNVRAHFYLAELSRDEGKIDEARREINAVASAAGNRYDPPEERWVKAAALRLAAKLK